MSPQKRRPKPKLSEHAATLKWFRSRVPIRKEDWLELNRKARERAFTVAHIAKLDVINDTLKALARAIEKGETLEQFRARIAGKLERAWGEERAWHVDVIFRNNMQAAYAHGREAEMRTPEALEERPYWLFSAILDARTTVICRPLNGTLLPADDPWWESHTPPMHHQCRSFKRPLTIEQADARGGVSRKPKKKTGEAQEGFGGADPLAWDPELEGYPPNLVREYQRKRR